MSCIDVVFADVCMSRDVCMFVVSLSQDGSGKQCLVIDPVIKSDAGWYTVSAINEAGMSTCNARLDVGSKCTYCVYFA